MKDIGFILWTLPDFLRFTTRSITSILPVLNYAALQTQRAQALCVATCRIVTFWKLRKSCVSKIYCMKVHFSHRNNIYIYKSIY